MSLKSLLPAAICLLASALLQCGASRHERAAKPFPAQTDPAVIVREPARSVAGEPLGLLVALHGHDQTEAQFAEIWNMGFFFEPNFILACVRAPFNGKRGYTWIPRNADFPGAKDDELRNRAIQTADDRVMAACDSLVERYGIDPDHIYIVGSSQGAGVAARIFLHHTDVFSGLAMLAGSMVRTLGEVPADAELTDMPVFISMGDAEPESQRSGAEWTRDELARAGADVQLFTHPEGHVIPQPGVRAMQNHLGLSYSFAPEVEQAETGFGQSEDERLDEADPESDMGGGL